MRPCKSSPASIGWSARSVRRPPESFENSAGPCSLPSAQPPSPTSSFAVEARLIRVSVQELQPEYSAEQRQRCFSYGVWDGYAVDRRRHLLCRHGQRGREWSSPPAAAGANARHCSGSDHCAGREDGLLDPERDAARIRAFSVHPEWARRGIGSRLLEVCEVSRRQGRFPPLETAVTLAGVPLYRARGV